MSWKNRVHGIGSRLGGSAVTASGMTVAAGAAGYYAAMQLSQRVEFLRGKWWAPPAAMAVAGHFARGKFPAIGAGVLGAAGAVGCMAYLSQRAVPVVSQNASGYGLSYGYGDAGDLSNAFGDAGALQTASDTYGTSDTGSFENRSDAGMLVSQRAAQARGYGEAQGLVG